jgi:TonB family protein
MSLRRTRRAGESRSTLWIALLISLLLHYPLVVGIVTLLDLEDSAPDEPMEVSLLEEEPEPRAEAEDPPKPEPKPEPRPTAEAEVPPKPLAKADQEIGLPTAPQIAEPLGAPEAPVETAEAEIPPEQVELEMDWAVFERAFAKEAADERREYQQQSQAKRRGGLRFGTMTGKVRRALHDNSSWVAAGQQEPLGKRKRTFRAYIHAIHDRIHHLFADSFLGSLSSLDPNDPLNDFNLMTKMEFEVLKSGVINDLHVIRSSGNTVFDAAAVDSILRSGPFPPPPPQILSWNDRVYFRWGFYRNNRKCGVFNAEPYILRAPGAAPEEVPQEEFMTDDG